jgi:SNF2 family DNA or RNA helicase
MAEAQAIDRIHRIGQKKNVEVVRYIVSDSIENVSFSPQQILDTFS